MLKHTQIYAMLYVYIHMNSSIEVDNMGGTQTALEFSLGNVVLVKLS